MEYKNIGCVVLGSYLNGYSIVQSLYEKGVRNIIVFDDHRLAATYSNKIKGYYIVPRKPELLKNALNDLRSIYDYLVVFPTSDIYLEHLSNNYDYLSRFCFLPFNQNNLIDCSDKYQQYFFCEQFDIPFPQTIKIETPIEIEKIGAQILPVILKPDIRSDLKINKLFRSKIISQKNEIDKVKTIVIPYLNEGIKFISSEIIPGTGDNIYAYTGYRNYEGIILNEWIGKKLSQHPNDYGVFASASNECPEIVREYGRKLLNGMNLFGICEPEFKYDYRDGKYKLMEINLRSMMWHRLGCITGVNLPYTQYCDAIGAKIEKDIQELNQRIHYVYLNHEILNSILRNNYLKTFYHNIVRCDRLVIAMFEWRDPLVFIIDIYLLIKLVFKKCTNILRTKLN